MKNSFAFLVIGVTAAIATTIKNKLEVKRAFVSKSINPLPFKPTSPFKTIGMNLKSENLNKIQPK